MKTRYVANLFIGLVITVVCGFLLTYFILGSLEDREMFIVFFLLFGLPCTFIIANYLNKHGPLAVGAAKGTDSIIFGSGFLLGGAIIAAPVLFTRCNYFCFKEILLFPAFIYSGFGFIMICVGLSTHYLHENDGRVVAIRSAIGVLFVAGVFWILGAIFQCDGSYYCFKWSILPFLKVVSVLIACAAVCYIGVYFNKNNMR